MKKTLSLAMLAALAGPFPLSQAASIYGWDCQLTAEGDYRCHASGAMPLPRKAPPASPSPAQHREDIPTVTPPATDIRPTEKTSTTMAHSTLDTIEPATSSWQMCAPIGALSAPVPPANQIETNISADQADIEQNEIYHLRGNAVIERAGERILANEIDYNQTTGQVDLQGDVSIEKAHLQVNAAQGKVNFNTDQGELSQVEYRLFNRHARGNAVMSYQDSAVVKRFEQATYTTCDKNDEIWRLDAKQVTLDETEGVGVARHAKLRVLDTPVFYTPYISFPIDDRRKSGFLFPTWGNSDVSGTDVTVPYYWNIAPNQDATITPRWLSKRGAQLKGEYRFLTPSQRGQVDLELLPSDNEYNDEDRILFGLNHTWQPSDRLKTTVLFNDVSDEDYFEDLGNKLGITSETHIRRTAEVRYSDIGWTLRGRLQDFQTVDDAIPNSRRPYKRLPQILFNSTPNWRFQDIEPSLAAELVHFDQDNRLTGTRLDLYPKLRRTFGNASYYVTPELGVRATHYSLSNTQPGDASTHDRVIPLLSVDSGLFFDRKLTLFGNHYVNTLEPRAYYLYVPEKDQSDIPRFDTSLRNLTYQGMFSSNRFSGPDRIGDANQLTLAISSRLLNPATGVQHVRFSTGQVFYFRDREVVLPGQSIDTANNSAMIAQTELAFTDRLSFDAGLEWDPYDKKTNLGNSRFKYQFSDRLLFNLSHRYRLNRLEQVDLSGMWQLTGNWQLAGRWNYSLAEKSLLEGIAAVQYESCCWVVRLGASSFLNSGNTNDERNDAVMLQFELKGLTSLGDPINEMLENGILGYRAKSD